MTTHRLRRRREPGGPGFNLGGAVMAGIWLVFLGYPVVSLFASGLSTPVLMWGLALVLVFSAGYFVGFGWSHRFSQRQVILWWLALLVPVLLLVPLIGWTAFSFTTYFVAIFVFCLPWHTGATAAGILLLGILGLPLTVQPAYV